MRPIIDNEFDSLVRREYEGLCRYAWRIVHNPEDATEIVQETFLRFHRMRATEEAPRQIQIRVLLYRVTRNLAIDCMRRRITRRRFEESSARVLIMPVRESAEQELLADERHGQLREALKRLKPKEVECLALKSEGHSYGDIALILNIHAGSVGPTITRALRRLRTAYLDLTRPQVRAGDPERNEPTDIPSANATLARSAGRYGGSFATHDEAISDTPAARFIFSKIPGNRM